MTDLQNNRAVVSSRTETLAIIPARGGSKSIPRKNIRLFNGHPLIAYSIAAARAAVNVTRVVVSTDDAEIAAVARHYHAETPFLRPAELSGDLTPDLPVFQHALEWFAEQEGYYPEIIVQLRPTSPLRRAALIETAIQSLIDHPNADSIRTVCIPFQNPFKMWRIGKDGFMQPLIPSEILFSDQSDHCGTVVPGGTVVPLSEPYNLPRQALPEVYWQTGYVDATRRNTILDKNSMTGEHILPLIIKPDEWIDIDSPDDWRRAERLVENGEISIESMGFSEYLDSVQ